jgi:hypothetical protein
MRLMTMAELRGTQPTLSLLSVIKVVAAAARRSAQTPKGDAAMLIFLRAGLATTLAVGFLMAPAILQKPENSASAKIIYEDDRGSVVDCGFITCSSIYPSRTLRY